MNHANSVQRSKTHELSLLSIAKNTAYQKTKNDVVGILNSGKLFMRTEPS